MTKLLSILCGLALILMTTACERPSSEKTQPGTQEATPQSNAAPTAAQAPVAPVAPATIKKGTVVENINAAGYTYILVDNGQEKTWIAVMETKVNDGEEISYYDGMVMENLFSKTLDRTFERVIFSSGLVGDTPASPFSAAAPAMGSGAGSFADALKAEGSGMGQAAPATGMGSSKAAVPFAEIKVDKATGENSFTVSELFAKATELNGKKVTVKGKVMKVSSRIMGRNWLHIQDGTGTPGDKTHDLVVTTSSEPQDDWEIVTVSGVLAADKDFGAGYVYSVIIEEAEISK